MYLKEESIYISGMFDTASYNLLPSFTEVFCFKKDDLSKIISREFEISGTDIKYKIYDKKIEEFLKIVFVLNDKEITNMVYYLERECGKCINIYEAEKSTVNKLDGNKYVPFYILENVYFFEFENIIICLMIGNNE